MSSELTLGRALARGPVVRLVIPEPALWPRLARAALSNCATVMVPDVRERSIAAKDDIEQ